MTLEDLILVDPVQTVARELLQQWPGVVFTSGRRTREDQARAMAQDVAQNRQWIRQTYAASSARAKCQAAVDSVPMAKLPSELAAAIYSVLLDMGDAELSKLSKHPAGLAFDVAPDSLPEEARDWLAEQAELHNGKLLLKEGGLVRVHFEAPALECD